MSKRPFYSEDMQAVLSDLLAYEISAQWSREEAILLPITKPLPLGTVLQKGVDGLELLTTEGTPFAVLARNVQTSEESQSTLVLRRGVVVNKDMLSFEPGVNAETAIVALDVIGIIAR